MKLLGVALMTPLLCISSFILYGVLEAAYNHDIILFWTIVTTPPFTLGMILYIKKDVGIWPKHKVG